LRRYISEGLRLGNRLVGLFGEMQTGARFVANRTGMTAMTEEMRRAAKKAERQGLTLVPISAQLELTLPRSAQLKLTLTPT
jgi:pheromone shutdown protein TraB